MAHRFRQIFKYWLMGGICILALGVEGCEKAAVGIGSADGDTDVNADTNTNTDTVTDFDTHSDADSSTDSKPDAGADPTWFCGDGFLHETEACDDGNTLEGDGCSGDCSEVAEGFSCIPPGKKCHPIAACGDGSIQVPELCDDGNLVIGDGCSDLCQVEIGFQCDDNEPSECTATVCGNAKTEGAESCDDGNTIPFDGCSSICQKEPDCADGACLSECGDGLLLGESEECDDGNNVSGDGCSVDCQEEDGYTCLQQGCEGEADCRIRVGVIYRDFSSVHPDFQVGCGGYEAIAGLVEEELDENWRPVLTPEASTLNACITQFADWYTLDPAKFGSEIPFKVDNISLFPNGDGSYVNRYGEDGEHWLGYVLDGNDEGVWVTPIADDVADCIADGCVECATQDTRGQGCPAPTVEYNGNPLFFPVDDMISDQSFAATVPSLYGWAGWPQEMWLTGEEVLHNFSFTSEVTYWFQYDESAVATLDFSGDDDVWVFVNGRLALDFGAPHVPLNDNVTISVDNNYGMEDGKVYKINIFHAERKATGSSFKLTLGGFNTARSECRPHCGDGVVGLGEECDDQVNAGGYGQCNEKCRFDGYCGDGIIQDEFENCDDGNYRNGDACPSSCRIIVVE